MEPVAQFARIESYGLAQTKSKAHGKHANKDAKTTVKGACGEASRIESFTPHLDKPSDKDLLFGMEPWDLQKLIYATAKKQETEADKSGQRKPRKDRLVLTAGVFSYPHKETDEQFFEWQADCISYLKEKYGDNLKSVVAHYDESHPHLHFFLANTKTLSIIGLDPAKTAQHSFRTLGDKTAPKQQDAIKNWLDDFQTKVSSKYGHKRQIGAMARARIHGAPRVVRKILDDIEAKQQILNQRALAVKELEQQNHEVIKRTQLVKFKADDLGIRNEKEAEKLAEKKKELKILQEQLKQCLADGEIEIAKLQKEQKKHMADENIDEAYKVHQQIKSSQEAFKKIRQSFRPRI